MNVYHARLARLIEHLQSISDAQFNMGIWMSDCGTVGCIAGHAKVLFNIQSPNYHDAVTAKAKEYYDYQRIVGDYLGLKVGEAHDLFIPRFLERRTRGQAIEVLQNYLSTGEVFWEELEEEDED